MTEQIDGIKMQTCKDKGVLEDIPGRLLFLCKQEVCHVLCLWILWQQW